MTAIRTAEARVITLTIEGPPDLANWDGKFHIVPTTVEIDYRWEHPDHHDSWYQPGGASIKVTGPRRLKSGGIGQQECTFEYHRTAGRECPAWLIELVAQHLPKGWDQ
ncbi:hypothetical protein [Kitasatospora viridis]|uniref:Uncharacterized protein n=1 Tax=Kitasatospora viridis TaxID=281105 RepID=A0A561UKP4_9ACTN|nr:hypothetical protein [Kitasatospora viridis]TWF99931.1 hypothetical protein FHX73_113791 [Kitasatospora viridis]